MDTRRSPRFRLLAGLGVTLLAAAIYSTYTVVQLRSLRQLQAEQIDRNRADSLLLLRIQNNLNSLALTMRDMLDQSEPYPLIAWKGQMKRIQEDLADALAREEKVSRATPDQRRYLSGSVDQFWDGLERIFAMAEQGQEAEARTRIRLSLQAREEALNTAVARLLVQNNESEEQAAKETERIYARAERNAYIFLAAMLVLIVGPSLYLMRWIPRMFAQVAALSERRSELARQLISMQESTFRSLSRELHDDFGQILTAIGAMMHRAGKRIPPLDETLRDDFDEVREIIQSTLDKIRTLSQALHPMVLDDAGLEGALHLYLAGYEKQTGIAVRYEKEGESRPLDRDVAIHVYRVLQESLNNVAKHSKSPKVDVRLRFRPETLVVEIEDYGIGFRQQTGKRGMGMTSMRERVELIGGTIEFLKKDGGGALVRFTVPMA
ncbi:MAG TPA: sensor histidine kinase [Bryobacteraceae bacterium]|nr:sensor histidine kinase [Bryobacteraceae bacterium]